MNLVLNYKVPLKNETQVTSVGDLQPLYVAQYFHRLTCMRLTWTDDLFGLFSLKVYLHPQ